MVELLNITELKALRIVEMKKYRFIIYKYSQLKINS